MTRAILLFAAIAVCAGGALARAPFADTPPLAHTGGFGEPTCAACHAGASASPAAGARAEIRGLPVAYMPGAAYALTIIVRHPAMKRAGFQVASRFEESPDSGAQAGSITTTDEAVDIRQRENGVVYAQHHGALTVAERKPAMWQVGWIAPERCSAVVFHLAANAADGDDSPFGDDILLVEKRVSC